MVLGGQGKAHADPQLAPLMTAPLLPDDELPLDEKTLDAFLEGMGTDMVLVGGQALAFWMDRYQIHPGMLSISNDGDALGRLERAQQLARQMKAELKQPSENARTSLVAQLRIGYGEKKRNIDVLHLLYTISGLKKSNEFTRQVWQRSVEIEWKPDHWIRVMHPLDVLESRAHNAVGLVEEKGLHVITQLGWAVDVAREAMKRVAQADDPGEERLGQMIQDVYSLAASAVGRRALGDHGIELLDAIPFDVIEKHRPEHGLQLENARKLLLNRREELKGAPSPAQPTRKRPKP